MQGVGGGGVCGAECLEEERIQRCALPLFTIKHLMFTSWLMGAFDFKVQKPFQTSLTDCHFVRSYSEESNRSARFNVLLFSTLLQSGCCGNSFNSSHLLILWFQAIAANAQGWV